jgi:hypothetical protein
VARSSTINMRACIEFLLSEEYQLMVKMLVTDFTSMVGKRAIELSVRPPEGRALIS